ncbi:tetratricopeptide repeat protein [Hoeflea poritis]|uniref:Tetratricopeptide repeat protein n=1 Tax=Hoeflea poritis TaxID=2993659 RepID=A0ABT4VJL4_9HYPH|nr:tetratricopeptide repeat protein [Hoeflea poritis]MDA4844794.1 tetratricopeptide repeat protein [Hoeflea poritis]
MHGLSGRFIAVIFFLLLLPTVAVTAPAEDHWSHTPDEAAGILLDEAHTYIKQGRFDLAMAVLADAAEVSPDNADVWNLIGYSQRNRGKLEESAQAYAKALDLKPDHLGALEYQGELFLLTGDIASAEGNLQRLRELCPQGCEERDELAEEVRAFRKKD